MQHADRTAAPAAGLRVLAEQGVVWCGTTQEQQYGGLVLSFFVDVKIAALVVVGC